MLQSSLYLEKEKREGEGNIAGRKERGRKRGDRACLPGVVLIGRPVDVISIRIM